MKRRRVSRYKNGGRRFSNEDVKLMFRMHNAGFPEHEIVNRVKRLHPDTPLTKEVYRNIIRGKYENKVIKEELAELDQCPMFKSDGPEYNSELIKRWERIKKEMEPNFALIAKKELEVKREARESRLHRLIKLLSDDEIDEIIEKYKEREILEVVELPPKYMYMGTLSEPFRDLEYKSEHMGLDVKLVKEVLYDLTTIDPDARKFRYSLASIATRRNVTIHIINKISNAFELARWGKEKRAMELLFSECKLDYLMSIRRSKFYILESAARYRSPRLKEIEEYLNKEWEEKQNGKKADNS